MGLTTHTKPLDVRHLGKLIQWDYFPNNQFTGAQGVWLVDETGYVPSYTAYAVEFIVRQGVSTFYSHDRFVGEAHYDPAVHGPLSNYLHYPGQIYARPSPPDPGMFSVQSVQYQSDASNSFDALGPAMPGEWRSTTRRQAWSFPGFLAADPSIKNLRLIVTSSLNGVSSEVTHPLPANSYKVDANQNYIMAPIGHQTHDATASDLPAIWDGTTPGQNGVTNFTNGLANTRYSNEPIFFNFHVYDTRVNYLVPELGDAIAARLEWETEDKSIVAPMCMKATPDHGPAELDTVLSVGYCDRVGVKVALFNNTLQAIPGYPNYYGGNGIFYVGSHSLVGYDISVPYISQDFTGLNDPRYIHPPIPLPGGNVESVMVDATFECQFDLGVDDLGYHRGVPHIWSKGPFNVPRPAVQEDDLGNGRYIFHFGSNGGGGVNAVTTPETSTLFATPPPYNRAVYDAGNFDPDAFWNDDFWIIKPRRPGNMAGVSSNDSTITPVALIFQGGDLGLVDLKQYYSVPGTFAPAPRGRYKWVFGDGTRDQRTSAPKVKHTYATPGTYHPICYVLNAINEVTQVLTTPVRVFKPRDVFDINFREGADAAAKPRSGRIHFRDGL